MSAAELKDSTLWFSGPEWLGETVVDTLGVEMEMPAECKEELKNRDTCHNLLVGEVSLNKILEIRDYSSLNRLCVITGLVLKFIECLRRSELILLHIGMCVLNNSG